MGKYDRKNVDKRLQREIKHSNRALDENSKTITQLQFIKSFEVFFFSGSVDKPHDEYIVHFKLNNPLVIKEFQRVVKNKMKGALVE